MSIWVVIYRFAVCFALLIGPVWSVQATSETYLSVDALKRGMRGVGRTVFQGTQIDTFDVEILGILRNVFGPKSNMILARLSGGPLAKTGVIAGMSGSPVYVDGKLIGAVGYSIGSFAKEPIAGITPIDEMMGVLNRTHTDTVSRADYSMPSYRTADAGEYGGQLRPVSVPLMLSGFTPEVIAEFRSEFEQFGLIPMQGGGGEDASLPEGPFEPGAPMGVQLIRGDFSVTGIGTLTHQVGDRVVGFGHPMLFGGRTAMPMTAAYIHQVVSSQMMSFKLGAAAKTMGVIVQDRAPGIAGVLGSRADMMPIRIAVHSPGQSETFRMEALRHRDLGPILVRMAVASSVIAAEKLSGETTVKAHATIALAGREPLKIDNVFAGQQGLGLAILGLTQPLARLMQNPLEPVVIDSVVFDLSVEERTRGAVISSVALSKSHFEAGDTLRISVDLKPLLGREEQTHLSLRIPAYVPKGRAMLRVMSERALRAQDVKRAPGAYKVNALDDLIRLLGDPGRNDVLAIELLGTHPTVTVEGREVAALPASVLATLKRSRKSNVVQQARQTVLGRAQKPMPYVLSGSQTVLISIGQSSEGLMFTGKGKTGEQKR